jgi:hypothetical protein
MVFTTGETTAGKGDARCLGGMVAGLSGTILPDDLLFGGDVLVIWPAR